MDLDFPFHFDASGHTATTDDDDHIRDLIEQVLFTTPGERVNRPNFGSGVLRLVFEPAGDAMAAAAQVTVHAALQQWLGEVIEVRDVVVEVEDATVRITVRYLVNRSQTVHVEQFTRSGP